jgi:deoxyribonuclease-4
MKKGNNMFNIGCHLSISKGFYKTAQEAFSIGANTFQFFTRNPRGGKAKELNEKDIADFNLFLKEHDFVKLFAHASYTMNLCSDKPEIREFAQMLLEDDLKRLKIIPDCYYIFHPGSHIGQGVDTGINFITEALNNIIDINPEQMILLEGMSGKGTEIGKSFDELERIINKVKNKDNMGVCFDTCHLYSAGYDIVNNLDNVLSEFDKKIGLERLKAIHLNDSKTEFNSHKDRHESIGKGTIGLEAICKIITHPCLHDLPFNLETPVTVKEHAEEIKMLRKFYNNKDVRRN